MDKKKSRVTRRSHSKRAVLPEIALESPIRHEDLPWSWVYYPNHYGTSFAFSEDHYGPAYLCSCSEAAVDNHIRLRKKEIVRHYADNLITAPLSSHYFPNQIAGISYRHCNVNNSIDLIRFENKLCHRCNQRALR